MDAPKKPVPVALAEEMPAGMTPQRLVRLRSDQHKPLDLAYGGVPMLGQLHCCGVLEAHGISYMTSQAVIKSFQKSLLGGTPHQHGRRVPFIMFTGVEAYHGIDGQMHTVEAQHGYGSRLAVYIEENGLGVVTTSPLAKSWTQSYLRVWIWQPNYTALENWKE